MSDEIWTYTPEGEFIVTPNDEPTPQEALTSFARLEERAGSPKYAIESSSVSGCPQPFLDVHVHDVEGNALAEVPVTLDFPEGGGKKAKTNTLGVAHFADVDVDASTLSVEVHREWPDDQDAPSYQATVVAKPSEPSEEDTPPPEEDTPMLYFSPWHALEQDDEPPEEEEESLATLEL